MKFKKTRLIRRFKKPNRFSKFNSRVSRSNYIFPILSDPLIINSHDYSSQNLQLDIGSQLSSNSQFIQLSDMYQYFRLKAVALKCSPVQIEGDYPPLAYAYLFGAQELNIQYSAIPRLPGAKLIKNNKTSTLYFKRFGLQDDFNWYKDSGDMPSVSLRIRLSETLQKAKYVFQLKFFVQFSMLVQYGSGQIKEEFEEIKNKNGVILTYDNEPETSFSIQANPQIKNNKNKIVKEGNINLVEKKYEIPPISYSKKQYPGLQGFQYDSSEDLSIEEIKEKLNEKVVKDEDVEFKKIKKPKKLPHSKNNNNDIDPGGQ
jgi:hypothetical protein